MIKLQYKATVKNGAITMGPQIRKRMAQEVGKAFDGKKITITIERAKKSRSVSQNAYYWSVVIPHVLAGFIDLGHDLQMGNKEHQELIHQLLKERLLSNGHQVTDVNGEVIQLSSSTKALGVGDFMDYLARVERWAQEHLNIAIPAPGEQTVMFS